MMGIGIGSVVVPMLAQRLITTFGWRITYAIFGGAVLLLPSRSSPPCSRTTLHNVACNRTETRKLSSHIAPQEKQGLTWHEIWHSPTFWIMICIFSLTGATVHGAILHMAAIFTDRGVTRSAPP